MHKKELEGGGEIVSKCRRERGACVIWDRSVGASGRGGVKGRGAQRKKTGGLFGPRAGPPELRQAWEGAIDVSTESEKENLPFNFKALFVVGNVQGTGAGNLVAVQEGAPVRDAI